jgi:hypothetical protein
MRKGTEEKLRRIGNHAKYGFLRGSNRAVEKENTVIKFSLPPVVVSAVLFLSASPAWWVALKHVVWGS